MERFDAIVTDKAGRPLAVVGGFKGARAETNVHPATLVAEAVRVPGAAQIWFSHNHPSGTPDLSDADKRLNVTISQVFRGSGIEPMGIIAVGNGRFGYHSEGHEQFPRESGLTHPIPDGDGVKFDVPVLELGQRDERVVKRALTSPAHAKEVAGEFYAKAREPGMLLLDSQNAIAGWLPLKGVLLGRLRDTGGLRTVYSAVSRGNFGAVIFVHAGELDVTPQELEGNDPIMNIGVALSRIGVRALDAVNVRTWESRAERGKPLSSHALFARAGDVWRSELEEAIEASTMKTAPAQGWLEFLGGLSKKGVKPDEIEWSGVREWLALQGDAKVAKADVLAYLEANGVQVEEMVKEASAGADTLQQLREKRDGINVQLTAIGFEIRDEYGEVILHQRVNGMDYTWIDGDFYDEDGEPLSDRHQVARDLAMQYGAVTDEIEALGGGLPDDGDTRYGQYTLPGGQNYRELLLTLPVKGVKGDPYHVVRDAILKPAINRAGMGPNTPIVEDTLRRAKLGMADAKAKAAEYEKVLRDAGEGDALDRYYASFQVNDAMDQARKNTFRSSHWIEPNIVAHIRMNERTDAEGKRVLFIEELQSDWAQQGRRKGFMPRDPRNPTDDEVRAYFDLKEGADPAEYREEMVTKVALRRGHEADLTPRAPFVDKTDAWLGLALKRVMKYAADNGFDRVAFVNGQQSADRYDLSKQVSLVTVAPWRAERGEYHLRALSNDGSAIIDKTDVPLEKLDDYVGKEVADRARKQLHDFGKARLTGLDLKVGGEGMITFYDKIVPAALNKLLPKLGGGKVQPISFGPLPDVPGNGWSSTDTPGPQKGAPREQPGFDVTPAMREHAARGMPLFARPGADTPMPSGLTMREVRDRIRQMRGAGVQEVQQAVDDFTRGWKNPPPIRVVETYRDLPIPAHPDVRGMHMGGRIWIVAAGHRAGNDLRRRVGTTLAHESIAHYGLRQILGADFDRLLTKPMRLAMASGNKAMIELRDWVRTHYRDQDGSYSLTARDEAEEMAARAVEQAIDAEGKFRPGFGWLKAVWARVRQFLRSHGWDLEFTDAELHGMLVLSLRGLERGKRFDGGGQAVVPAMAERDSQFAQKNGSTRREVIVAAIAAIAGDRAGARVTLGRAAPINATVLGQALPAPVEKILRGNGDTNPEGAVALRKALDLIASSGPQEVRQLAAQISRLLPHRGFMLTVDDEVSVNLHGAVELRPIPHLWLFTKDGSKGLTYEVFLHESFHLALAARYRSLSVGLLRSNDAIIKMPPPAAAKAMAQFRDVWHEFRTIARAEKAGDKDLQVSLEEAAGDPDEFFVRALTDPRLQAWLGRKEYQGKTLLERFKDWVKTTLLGFSKVGTAPSWLDAALVATNDLNSAMHADAADFQRLNAINRVDAKKPSPEATKNSRRAPGAEAKARAAARSISEGGVTHPQLLRDLMAVEGWGSFFQTHLAGPNTGQAKELRAELASLFPGDTEGLPILMSDSGILEVGRGELVAGRWAELTALADRFDAPIIVRDQLVRPRVPAQDMRALGFERYMGPQEMRIEVDAVRPLDHAIHWVRPAAGITDTTPLFARGQEDLFAPQEWAAPDDTVTDKILYELQDGRVDLKRVQQAIEAAGQGIDERFDARLAETLYPGRVARRSELFLDREVKPLLKAMARIGASLDELGDYLLARHAPDRNAQIARVNPDLPDGGAGRNSRGDLMTTEAAQAYIQSIPAQRRALLDELAAAVDRITAGTRRLLVAEGLESQSTIDAWVAAQGDKYVPLFKDEAEQGGSPHPIGAGFTVRGPASKRATGSTKQVHDVLAHVLMQREAAITRAEKNRVGLALYGLALSHPNPEFWTTIRPSMSNEAIGQELQAMGVDPDVAVAGMQRVPTVTDVDKITGQVVRRPNPLYKSLPGAITLRLNGEDRVLLLNAKNERAARLAADLKNLDGMTRLDLAGSIVGKSTRWLAAVNTQYNPAFGLVNVTRDTWGGLVNLGSTPLRGRGLKVLADVPKAIAGIGWGLFKQHHRGESALEWSKLWEQFQADGGRTGYRELFRRSEERALAIERELRNAGPANTWLVAKRGAGWILNLLDGFNMTLENAVRLAAYKEALDKGLSRAEAARLGRELTVDFNRKGRSGRELQPLYAFFNASVQGQARTIQTLKGPTGAAVIAGGLTLGVIQALMLLMADYDDDEIPEFVKARSLIIPLPKDEKGEKRFLSIPYPLGLHVLPNTGRVLTEMGLNGGKDMGRAIVSAIGELAGAFNPLGGGNIFTAHGALNTVAPTVVDPIVDIAANRNFADMPIERESMRGELDNRPGFTRARERTLREVTGQAYIEISRAFNAVTGGTPYERGMVSPTPERVRFIAHTVGGGVLREIEKAVDSSHKALTGQDVKLSGIPVVGRFKGEVDPDRVTQSRYWERSRTLDKLQSSARAAEGAGDGEALERLLQRPEAVLIQSHDKVQRSLSQLNRLAAAVVNDREQMKAIDEARLDEMRGLNAAFEEIEAARGPTPGQRLKQALRAGPAQ